MQRCRIIPERIGFKISFVFWQPYLHPPLRPGGKVKATHDTTYTTIIVILQYIINRCGCPGRMPEVKPKIVFNTPTRPWAADTDGPKLHYMIIVNKLIVSSFFHRTQNFTSYLWQYGHGNKRIFQLHHFPIFDGALIGISIKNKVGVKRRYFFVNAQYRNGIGIKKRIRFKWFILFCYGSFLSSCR